MVVLKVAGRCNLNCSYCYVYNKADATWRELPGVMPESTFLAAVERIRNHCTQTGQKNIVLLFHGGEPCLLGAKQFDAWCTAASEALAGLATVQFMLQTNGTLLDEKWIATLKKHKVRIGISIDGPRDLHDAVRVDRKGQGSYDKVIRGLDLLRESLTPFSILSVIPLGSDPLRIHRHLLSLRSASISYIFPDFTHDTIAPVISRYGPTPCADFLIPIFDDWWMNGTLDVRISNFLNMARIILGGESSSDTLGNRPFGFLFVGTDGAIEGLDSLRSCKDGLATTGLNVFNADFLDVISVSDFHTRAVFSGLPLPDKCCSCVERETCGGGYLPHRYSSTTGFNNASVWCADLLKLFAHIRTRLEVSAEDTHRRRGRIMGDWDGFEAQELARKH